MTGEREGEGVAGSPTSSRAVLKMKLDSCNLKLGVALRFNDEVYTASIMRLYSYIRSLKRFVKIKLHRCSGNIPNTCCMCSQSNPKHGCLII